MIILISPTKTFTKATDIANSSPIFENKANYLIEKIKELSVQDLKLKFKLSEKLSEQTYDYYQNLHNNFAAVYQYGGTAFKYLDPINIDKDKLSNLYILSGLYGILNAFDGISPYRLEITDRNFLNLFDYWKHELNEFLSKQDNKIINLASGEYTKHLDFNNDNILTIDFILNKDGKNTQQSMMLKKMRGLMANHLLTNDVDFKDLINVEIDGFKYSKELSNEKLYYFYKEE